MPKRGRRPPVKMQDVNQAATRRMRVEPSAYRASTREELAAIVEADLARTANLAADRQRPRDPHTHDHHAFLRQQGLQAEVNLRGLSCFKCGATQADWHKVDWSPMRHHPKHWWAICQRCVNRTR